MIRKISAAAPSLFAFCLLPLFASAQSSPPSPFDGPAFTLAPAAIREASGKILPDKLSDATILYEETDYRFAANGSLTYTNRMVYRIETQKGVEDWGEISLNWDPWYENSSQLHARVLQNDGSMAELDQKTVTDGPVNSSDEQTYTAERQRKAPLPGLAVGAIVEQVVSVEDKTPYFAAGLAYRYYFTNSAPVEREKVVIDIPSSLPFHEHLLNLTSLPGSHSEQDGMKHIVYIRDHQGATVYGDIDLPSMTNPVPILEFATGSSWANVAQGYASLSEPRIVPAQVKAMLPAALAGTRLARIRQLVEALHKNVRYTGIEFNEAEIVPQAPAEVLKRHYGDCKDKAALLVSMLRAEGIPASMALLSAGTGRDVDAELPGMNLFNHAIVYVPASGTDPALWIDATAEFNAVGTLPYQDANRLALIIAPETASLVATPQPKPEDSVLTETRTFHLADLGPSQAVEESETRGYIDASYRSAYGSATTKKVHDDLERYAENFYLAKRLARIDHGEGADLSKPFRLTLSMEGVRRGYTALVDSEVALYPASTLNNLPQWLRNAPVPLAENASPEQKEERALAEAHRSETYHIEPSVYEQDCVIYAPPGFSLRALPQDHTTQVGPAILTEHYSQESPSLVKAVFRFDTQKSILTAKEAVEMRDIVAELSKRAAVEIVFEEQGQKLLQDGRIKEALASDQATITANPKSALPHVRLARALLDSGAGDMARAEAARAVALDPGSAAALVTQGWVLEHDTLGRRFGDGFDRAGAIEAFRKAEPLKSDDFDPRMDLAVLYEFDTNGSRYTQKADLASAAEVYRSLIDSGKKNGSSELAQYRVNLGYALLFARQYRQLETLLPDIAPGLVHSTLAITSAVAEKDAAAGIASAAQLNLSAADRNKVLVSAGNNLAEMGLYSQAAEMLAKGVEGQSDAPAVARRIEIYRNLKRVPADSPPITSPESLIFASLNMMMSGDVDRTSLAATTTPHAYPDAAAFQRDLDKSMSEAGFLRSSAANSDISMPVLRDMLLGSATFKTTGDDATGYRVLCQFLGQTENLFVVKEDGTFRIVSDGNAVNDSEVGWYALYALDRGQKGLAKSLLDWKRDLVHRGGGDDPLQGPLLPLFWTVGSSREGADSTESMRLAAISLVAGSMGVKPLLDGVVPLREKAAGERLTDLDLLLARGYLGAEQPAAALPFIASLLKEEPDSSLALALAGNAYQLNGDAKSWKQLLDARLVTKPEDADLLREQARLQVLEHDYAAAQATAKLVFDTGHATGADYNNYAWLGLFDHHLGADVTDAAQKANSLSKNGGFSDLHTTACIYAAQGKITEARQVLAQAMTAGNLARPNSQVWFVLGQLYEDYGLREAALVAYRKVQVHEFDNHTFVEPDSTYMLAQQGIQRLTY